MKILSIDVGIKNLAFCILQAKNNIYEIVEWEVIDLCSEITNNCNNCNKKAKYFKNNDFFCSMHAKKCLYKIPTISDNLDKIKQLNINNLKEKLEEYDISYNKPIKKNELINILSNYLETNYLNLIKNTKAGDINIIELGINLKSKFDSIYDKLSNIDLIIIENQISPIANRMKTLQGMITQYFIMHDHKNIEFISAINKLKLFNGEKIFHIINVKNYQ